MDIVLKIYTGLTGLFGASVLLASFQKNFNHKGMTFAGLSYLLGGSFGLYFHSWWPAITGIIIAIIIKKIFGEPDYSETLNNEDKSSYQIWWETYKPLMGPAGEPLNYIVVIKNITDMTEEEKEAYIEEKINKNLLWTVVDIGNEKALVRPGKHGENVKAWWICDVPFTETARDVEIQF